MGDGRRRVGTPRALRFARALLVFSATGIGVGLAELALRLAGLPHAGPFLQEFRGDRYKLMCYDSNPTGALDLELGDADLRRRLAGRLRDPEEFEASWVATPHCAAFEYGSQGFREKKLEPKRPGTTRIVVVGDSFTVGHGLPNALAYPRLLEARLQRRFEHGSGASPLGASVEVLNLGRGNTDLPAIARSADFALRHLDPDVLVYGYFMNDPVPTIERAPDTPVHDMLDAGWISLDQSPTRLRIGGRPQGPSRVVDLVARFVSDRRVTEATIAWYRRLHEPETWRPARDRIAAMAAGARSKGARFVLLLLPLPFEIDDSPFAASHAAMKSACESLGIEVVDALPALARYTDDALRLHPRDRHPSPLYTRVVAELLDEVLASGPAAGGEAGAGPASSSPTVSAVPTGGGEGRARSPR